MSAVMSAYNADISKLESDVSQMNSQEAPYQQILTQNACS